MPRCLHDTCKVCTWYSWGHGTNSTTFLVVCVATNCARTVPRERSRCGHDTHAKGKTNGLQACLLFCLREDVSAWKRCHGNGHFLQGSPFPYYWPFVRRIQRSLDRRDHQSVLSLYLYIMINVFAYISLYTRNNIFFLFALFSRLKYYFNFANYYCTLSFHRRSLDAFFDKCR